MDSNILEHVIIKGLHKKQDINLFFAGSTTIFIADNGSGKTTALYILNSILSNRLSELSRYNYESISIKFANHDPFIITPKGYELSRGAQMLKNIVKRSELSVNEAAALARQARQFSYTRMKEDSLLVSAARQLRMPTKVLYDRLVRIDLSREKQLDLLSHAEDSPVIALKEFLEEKFEASVLYFPTYRRVEQEMEQLLSIDPNEDEVLESEIHFGMKDVNAKIEDLTSEIRDHFVTSYGKISGEMLGQLAENTSISPQMAERLSDRSNIELVLGRVGRNVTESQKSLILRLFDDGSLLANRHLSFFLSRLIQAYDDVRSRDTALQRYASICNGYLINKTMKYDSLNATLKLYEDVTNDMINLEHLSSGEKQVLGIMSDIYLGREDFYAVIFDEPELSLSVEWQKKILVDVASSGKCYLLVAATHSPFVFENELDAFARSLDVSFRPSAVGG